MSAAATTITLTEEEENRLHTAKLLLRFATTLGAAHGGGMDIDPEEVAAFAQVVYDLLPERI